MRTYKYKMTTSKIEEIRARLEEVEIKGKVLADTLHFKKTNVRRETHPSATGDCDGRLRDQRPP